MTGTAGPGPAAPARALFTCPGFPEPEELMHTLERVGRQGLLAVALLAVAGTCAGQGDKVEVRPVHLADLEKTIKALKGKVVVVDYWGFD
jgi:hypothetical protein